jgi:hypothetical protein
MAEAAAGPVLDSLASMVAGTAAGLVRISGQSSSGSILVCHGLRQLLGLSIFADVGDVLRRLSELQQKEACFPTVG